MKIAGLMPVGGPLVKLLFGSDKQLKELSDCLIIRRFDEWGIWNDYAQRFALLVDALRNDCDWCLWLDDDETTNATKDDVTRAVTEARKTGAVAVSFRILEMWNQTHYRSDGIWNTKRRVVIQKNPLMEGFVHWRGDWSHRLHSWPLQFGPIIDRNDLVVYHWGMSTPGLRMARLEKYRQADPNNEFQKGGYDYLLDENGIELTPHYV